MKSFQYVGLLIHWSVDVPMFLCSYILNFSHITCLPFVLCPSLGNPHRSPIRWLTISTSPSSHDTFSIRFVTVGINLTKEMSFKKLKNLKCLTCDIRGYTFPDCWYL